MKSKEDNGLKMTDFTTFDKALKTMLGEASLLTYRVSVEDNSKLFAC